MSTDYRDRLNLPIEGSEGIEFFTHCGCRVAKGYVRVVIGDRGPYIEFADRHIIRESIHIPENARWRMQHEQAFYVEHRSVCACNVKLYQQLKTVDYADYKVGMWYISPFDLKATGYPVLIEKKKNNNFSLF